MEEILVLECGGVQEIEILHMKNGKLNAKNLLNIKNLEFDLQTNIRAMVEDVFQQVNEPMALEERIMESVKRFLWFLMVYKRKPMLEMQAIVKTNFLETLKRTMNL